MATKEEEALVATIQAISGLGGSRTISYGDGHLILRDVEPGTDLGELVNVLPKGCRLQQESCLSISGIDWTNSSRENERNVPSSGAGRGAYLLVAAGSLVVAALAYLYRAKLFENSPVLFLF